MAIVRWSPARDLMTFPSDILGMQREMNKMFDRFFRGSMSDQDEMTPASWLPGADLIENEDAYIAKVELPGVSKEDVKITLQDNSLTIRGEKKEEKETKESNYHRLERSYGSFQRTLELPGSIKSDKVEAEYKEGILTIKLPKAEESKRKLIDVRVK